MTKSELILLSLFLLTADRSTSLAVALANAEKRIQNSTNSSIVGSLPVRLIQLANGHLAAIIMIIVITLFGAIGTMVISDGNFLDGFGATAFLASVSFLLSMISHSISFQSGRL